MKNIKSYTKKVMTLLMAFMITLTQVVPILPTFAQDKNLGIENLEKQNEIQTNEVTMDPTLRSTTDVLTNWKYTLSGDTYILTEYIGTSLDVVIPSLIDGKKVALDVGTDDTKNQNFFPAEATSITIEETGNKVTLIRNTLMNVFRGKRAITSLDLSNLDTSNIVDMRQVISTNVMLETIDVTGWDTSNVILMSRMFQENKVLKEIKGMNFNTSKVESMEQMFFDNPKLLTLDVTSFDTSSVNDIDRMFSGCKSLSAIDLSGFDTTKVISFTEMFANCEKLEQIDVSRFNTSNATQIGGMFLNCKKVKAIDVTGFDTSKIIEISKMFAGCESLEELDVSGFTTVPEPASPLDRVRSLRDMFNGCKSLKTIDLGSLNSSAVLFMTQAFVNCSSVQVFDLENFNPPNLSASYNGVKDVFTIADPSIKKPVPTIIINSAPLLSGLDTAIPGRTYGGPLYDANGGELSAGVETARYFNHFIFADKTEFAVTKETVAKKYTPSKQGSIFSGWYTDEECTTPYISDTTNVDLTTEDYMNLTLYAGWAKTITFDSQGGTSILPIDVNEGSLIVKPTNPTKTGQTFMGWYSDSALTTPWDFANDTVSDNMTLYAAWGYTVTFTANNGSTDSVVVVKVNESVAKVTDPTKTGYTFAGWYKEATLLTPWNFNTDTVSANTQLFAKWNINTYTVTFANTTLSATTLKHGETVVKPSDPSKVGHTFNGWYKDAACTIAWDFTNDNITANTTIYAKWSINEYTVSFDHAGIAIQNIDYGNKVIKPTDPTKTGYTFAGWYKEATLLTPWNFDTDTVSANTQLFAKWNINTYTVTFANTTLSATTLKHGETVVKPSDPSKEGHTFNGWYKDAACTIAWDFTNDNITANTTIYAKWSINTYIISFDEASVAIQNIDYGNKVIKPTDPTKTGYTFAGWYKEATLLTPWNFDTDTVSANTQLFAKWNINAYTVTFANTTLSAITLKHGETVVKPSDPSKEGHTFIGWYKDAECTIVWDFTIQTIVQDTTIYAKWEIITSTLFFDADNGEATMQQKELVYNETYGTFPTPTKETLIFAGWFTQPYGQGTQRVETDIVSAVEDETLYAYWIQNHYYTTNGDLRFENGQDSRYNLQIDASAKDIVQDNQNLMSVYDIYLLLDNDRVNIDNTDIWISIKLKENERNFAYYKVAYINEVGESVEEYIPILSAEKDVLMFKVNHLSYYAIYAWNEEESASILPPSNASSSKNEAMGVATGESEGNTGMNIVMLMSSLLVFCGILRKRES